MNKDQIQARFRQAGILYLMKEYGDALDILDELLVYAPSSRQLLFAKAKCLAALGFREEARKICGNLVHDTMPGMADTANTPLCPEKSAGIG